MNKIAIKQLMLMASLVLLGFARTAQAGTCEIKQAADSPEMVASPFSLVSVFNAFNADPSLQACKSISFSSDVNLEHTIVISGNTADEDGKRLVIDGKQHVINAATSAVDTNGCAIVIFSSNVQISNLHVLNGGICVGSDDPKVLEKAKVNGVTKNVSFTSIYVEKSPKDGILIAKNTKNVVVGEYSKIYYSGGNGIHYMESDFQKLIPDSHRVFVTEDPAAVNSAVSFYQSGSVGSLNGLTIKVEGDAPMVTGIRFTQTSIQGYLSSGIAKDVKMLAYRTNGNTPAVNESTFIGFAKVQIGGFFNINTIKQLSETSGDVISLVPLWSSTSNTTVLGSSTPPIQVKFTGTFSVTGNTTGGSGQGGTGAGDLPQGVTHYIINGVDKYFIKDPTFAMKNSSDACQILKQLMGSSTADSQISNKIDSDLDGIPDIIEDRNLNCNDSGETSPYNADTDGDGILDGEEDTDKSGFINCYRVEDAGCTDGSGAAVSCDSSSFMGVKDKLGLYVKADKTSMLLKVKSPIDHKVHTVLPLWNNFSVEPKFQSLKFSTNNVACTDQTSYPLEFLPEECKDSGDKFIVNNEGRHNLFDASNGDFCAEMNPMQKDSDGDGVEDAEELWGMIYNPAAPNHLYWPNGDRLNPGLAADEKCDLSNSKGRKLLAYQAVEAEDGKGAKTKVYVTLVCVSDSIIPNNSNSFTVKFDEKSLQAYSTDPLSPDSDEDKLCDGNGSATKNGCGGMQVDNCPTFHDLNNECKTIKVCATDLMLYTKMNPANRNTLLDAVKTFDGKGGYQALIAKLKSIDPNGAFDTDEDGIPDVVENPWGTCQITQQEKAFFSNPFKKDSDEDGESDKLDPFPTNPKKGLKDMPAGSNCPQVVDYSSHMAIYCAADWDGDGLYNCEENPDGNLSINVDSASYKNSETCPERADSENDGMNKGDGLTDLEERQAGTNPWNPDTDVDGLTDYQEVYGDSKPGLSIVFSSTPGCYNVSKWVYTDKLTQKFDTDPAKEDTDGDGLKDGTEITIGTNPVNPDSDGDGLCDGGKEVVGATGTVCIKGESLGNDGVFPYLPTDMATSDYDSPAGAQSLAIGGTQTATLPNGRVITASNPCAKDTDIDGKNDWMPGDWEGKSDSIDPVKNNRNISATTPNAQGADSDLDGIPDSIEINQLGTDPKKADHDGDGLEDGCVNFSTPQMRGELCAHFTSATNANFASLSKGPGKDFNSGMGDTDPMNADTDTDGMKDGDELKYPDNQFKNPYQTDAGGKLTYIGLYQKGVNLNPNFYDTDGDGILDGVEAGAKFKPGSSANEFYCGLSGQQAAISGGVTQYGSAVFTAQQTYAASGPNPLDEKGTGYDTDGDGLPDGNTKTYLGRNAWGEDLNCDGQINIDKNSNPMESDPRTADSNHDGVSDKDAICRNGICDPSVNLPYVYARQAGGGCSNTIMPGITVPATAGDVATLLMFLAPLGVAVRMRMRMRGRK